MECKSKINHEHIIMYIGKLYQYYSNTRYLVFIQGAFDKSKITFKTSA